MTLVNKKYQSHKQETSESPGPVDVRVKKIGEIYPATCNLAFFQ